jgi:GT2 family glycosyltransferase
VRWIEQDPALGMLENFLAGLDAARGTYVAVLHDDDRWSPRFLAVLVPQLENHPEAVLAFADHYLVDERGDIDIPATEACTRRWGRAGLREGLHRPFHGIVARESVPMTGCLFRRDALAVAEITPEVGSFYDVWISYLLARSGGAAYFTPERLLYYRAHAASHSGAGHVSGSLAAIRCRRRMLADPALGSYAELITRRLAADHRMAGAVFLRDAERVRARSHLAAALRLHPTLKALGGWAASWVAPAGLLGRL